ncbi:hypothetical protein [Aliihoeflea sp. 2WW]|uniref:hypothetical protein n=1 Tax=Aliihoeflea sp. 2WW TaxID=1381123 RepID=UPI0004635126|nr:hypothetical protein [Aliihoeflea sp. 2WW]
MKLADDITITLAGEEIILHPALRHAIRLERRPGSFAKLMAEIEDDTFATARELIADHHDHPALDFQVLDALPTLKEPLLRYVVALTGIDPDAGPSEGKAKAKAVPFAEHLTQLYRIGTGWLGWTPVDTLDAAPAETIEAHKGRVELLRMIFGSGEKTGPTTDDRPLNEKFRSIFASHGTTKEAA